MSEAISISTSKYIKTGKVNVDGHIWEVKLPGAGTELKLGQATRRLKYLDKKLEAGTATEEDLDKYDELEELMYGIFKSIFKDETDDNSEVEAWMEQNPLAIITAALEDIKKQANNGSQDKTTSS